MKSSLLMKSILMSIMMVFLLSATSCQKDAVSSTNPLNDNQAGLIENPFSPGYKITLPSFTQRNYINPDFNASKSNSITSKKSESPNIDLQDVLKDLHLTGHQNKAVNGFYKDYLDCLEEAFHLVDLKVSEIQKYFYINKNAILAKLKNNEIDEETANAQIDELSKKADAEIDDTYNYAACRCLNILFYNIEYNTPLNDSQKAIWRAWVTSIIKANVTPCLSKPS